MIKKFKLYILLAAVAFSCTSCLDKMPEDAIPFDKSIQTVDDVIRGEKRSVSICGRSENE